MCVGLCVCAHMCLGKKGLSYLVMTSENLSLVFIKMSDEGQ